MCQIRIISKLGGKVGELGIFKRDLADLCEIQPKLAGEWVSGGIERISLVDLARIMAELEIYDLNDIFTVEIIGTPPPKKGRRERIMAKLAPLRMKRKQEDQERRKIKIEIQRQKIAEELRQESRKRGRKPRK